MKTRLVGLRLNYLLLGIAMVLFGVSSAAMAERYWPATLTEWSISLNNGVVYISSSQFAEHCAYRRGQINVNDGAYARALYAYALSAKARGKNLRYVVERASSECVIDAMQEE